MNCVLNGILRACGRQALGARLHLTAYWLCGERGASTARLCTLLWLASTRGQASAPGEPSRPL